MRTLLLRRAEVEALLDPVALVPDLRAALRFHSAEPGLRAQA